MPHSKVRWGFLTPVKTTFGKLVNKTTFAKNLKGLLYKSGIEINTSTFQ